MRDSELDKSLKLSSWLNGKTQDEISNLFFNMDLTMKYLHEHGYCIKSFNPNKITLLNNSEKFIKYDSLLKMTDDNFKNQSLKNEDILNFAFLQIAIYSNCLDYLKLNFVRENFDKFTTFIPSDYVNYFRGIIQRGANVYYSDFIMQLKQRNYDNLVSQFDNENDSNSNTNSFGNLMGSQNPKALVRSNGKNIIDSNTRINDNIYNKINRRHDAAFVGTLIFPIIISVVGIILFLLLFFSKMS